MLRTARPFRSPAIFTVVALSTWLGACSDRHFDAAMAAEPSRRVIVSVAKDWSDTAALSAALGQAAQVPVANLQAVAHRQWAITLGCGKPSLCDAATERLGLAHDLVLSVEAEHLQTIPQQPPRSSAR